MLRDGPLETDTSSGSNSAPAQPEKTNEQSNVECKECRDCPRGAGCSFEPDYCLGNASARLLRRLLSGQPKIWLACDTSKFSKRIALGCSVAKWEAEVNASYGVSWSHWSGASGKQIQYKADGAKWFAKVRAKTCYWP